MLQIVAQLSEGLVTQLTDHLNNLADKLTPDVSNYAKGRQRFWIEHEAPLTQNQNFKPGVKDERLWSWIKRSFPEVDLGLAAYGSVGIKMHRDAGYADFTGYSINLGNIEGWTYDRIYPEYSWVPPEKCLPSNPVTYPLQSGDVVKFNVKNPHAPVNPAADRWSINLWKVSNKTRPKFEEYLRTL